MRVIGWPAFSNQHVNPYNSLLYRAMREKGVEVLEYEGWRTQGEKVDVVHIHWPDQSPNAYTLGGAILRCARYLFALVRMRLGGAKVVWTAHNLSSHDNLHPALEKLFWKLLVPQLDGVISLSEGAISSVRRRVGGRDLPIGCVPHGHYREAYPNGVDRPTARRKMGIEPEAFVVGWVGQIRRYKGLQELAEAWRKNAVPGNVLLLGGHCPEPELRQQLLESARMDASIRFHDGRVEDGELQYYLNAADVMIMPYRKILNSGSALLALSFDRPIAVPCGETMLELQKLTGPEWVFLYDGAFDEKVLAEICRWARKGNRAAKAPLRELDWDVLAGKTIDFFRQVVAGQKS